MTGVQRQDKTTLKQGAGHFDYITVQYSTYLQIRLLLLLLLLLICHGIIRLDAYRLMTPEHEF